jgi:hypothetical protein
MGVRFIFNYSEAKVCLLICRRSSSGRPTLSPLLLEELAPARHHMEHCDHDLGRMGPSKLIQWTAWEERQHVEAALRSTSRRGVRLLGGDRGSLGARRAMTQGPGHEDGGAFAPILEQWSSRCGLPSSWSFRCDADGSGWSRYRLMDGVRTLGRQAREATMSRVMGSGSEMEARD